MPKGWGNLHLKSDNPNLRPGASRVEGEGGGTTVDRCIIFHYFCVSLASLTYAALITFCDMTITWSFISAAKGLTTTKINRFSQLQKMRLAVGSRQLVNSNSHCPSGGTQTRFCPAKNWIVSFVSCEVTPSATTLQQL